MTETKKEVLAKELEKEKIIKEEKARTAIEKYKIKEIGGWAVLPWLLFLVFFIYILYNYIINESFDWYLFIPIGTIGFLMGMASEVEDNWKIRLIYKEKIYGEDENYRNDYEYDYVYTDSRWDCFLYKTAKAISYLVSFILVAIIGILLFMWIGSISIAPTTIIIILLIIIIINQNRER